MRCISTLVAGLTWRALVPVACMLALTACMDLRPRPAAALVLTAHRQEPTTSQRPGREPAATRPRSARPGPDRANGRPPARAVPFGPFRGFSHAVHRHIPCTACHAAATAHGALLIRSVQDCRRCHHSPAQRVACTGCHAPAKLPQNVPRTVAMRTSVAPPAIRTLPFSHAAHADVACGACHSGPPTLMTLAGCASCHARHHTPRRDCRLCHTGPVLRQHTSAAHIGCGGVGCHRDAAVDALTWSRQVCLVCHRNMANHMPGQDCAGCHAVPPLRPAPPGARPEETGS